MSVPSIIVGVTGHRDIRAEDYGRLGAVVSDELEKLKKQHPNGHFTMRSSLAEGADLICAAEAVKAGFALEVPLPFELEEYKKDFKDASLAELERLLNLAEAIYIAPKTDRIPETMTRDFGYRQAGLFVAKYCDVLFALWDGSPSSPSGCGTSEAVEFARNYGVTVLQIVTPRLRNPQPEGAFTVRS